MLEPRSALEAVYEAGHFGSETGPDPVTVYERAASGLLQVSGWPESIASLIRHLAEIIGCAVPGDGITAVSHGELVLFRVGPERLWLIGPALEVLRTRIEQALPPDEAVLTDLGHSRTVLRLGGPGARVLLSRGLPIDLDERAFAPNAFAQSVVHHIPVLVHRLDAADEAVFDAYVARDLAVSFWEWLIAAAAPLGGNIEEPR